MSHDSGSRKIWRRALDRFGLRALGIAILVLAFTPVFRLLGVSAEVPFRQISVDVAEATLQFAWWGTIVTLLASALLALLLPTERLRTAARRVFALLRLPSSGLYAGVLTGLGVALASWVAFGLFRGLLTNVDEFASLLHARYLAHGLLAGPTFSLPEFWLIPNTLVVAKGWVSHYPPTHLFALALMERVGARLLLGPLAFGAMVGLAALSFIRLLPEQPTEARVAGLLVALSPFLLFLGGGLLSHVTAGALAAATLYAALRARDGSARWAVATGAAIGLMVADRPLVGLVLGVVFTFGVWVPEVLCERPLRLRWFSLRVAGTAAGGLPLAILLGWFNQRLFGSPLTLGYLAAFGERHGLGFHLDPWGSPYGITEAIAFTSTDLLALGVQLLETPYPATAVIGIALLTGLRVSRSMALLLAWAFLPVLANAFYWFHSGRMLYEAAPAWVALFVLSAAHLARSAAAGETHRLTALAGDACVWALALGGVIAVGWDIPVRWESYAWNEETLERITVPSLPTDEPSIIFVHTSWNERLSSLLQGAGGMRQDSVINLVRRNTHCALDRYAVAREARVREGDQAPLPPIDLLQIAGSPAEIDRFRVGPTLLRTREGEEFTERCRRELRADRFGTVALSPLLWQGDLPGIEEGRPLFVRDFGLEKNRRLLEHYPNRTAWAFLYTSVDGTPEILPYEDAMELLWGDAAAPGVPSP